MSPIYGEPYIVTAVVYTNLRVNFNRLFSKLPVAEDFEPRVSSKREEPAEIEPGTITFINSSMGSRGNFARKRGKPFDNTLTIEMYLDSDYEKKKDKIINIKLPSTGNLHMTGCRNVKDAIFATKSLFYKIWEIHSKENRMCYLTNRIRETTVRGKKKPFEMKVSIDKFFILPIVHMQNVSFNIGTKISPKEFAEYIDTYEEMSGFRHMFEPGTTSAGMKVVTRFKCPDVLTTKYHCYDLRTKQWSIDTVVLADIEPELAKGINEKLIKKDHTIMVFQKGQAIHSATGDDEMNRVYAEFMKLIERFSTWRRKKRIIFIGKEDADCLIL